MSVPDEKNVAAYEEMRQSLQSDHVGEWVLFHDGALEGMYTSCEKAADDAVRRFGCGPCLIRQVGARSAGKS
jgi:hypothetical protein